MRRAWMLGFIVITALCPGAARADLFVAAPVIELGEIRGGQRLAQRFELVNRGDAPVEIVEVQRGCGCLAARLEQRLVPAGGKATIQFELRTLGQPEGPHTWHAQVHYRAGGQSKALPVALRGTIRNEVTLQPAILALHVDKAARQEITLVDSREPPLRVLGAEVRSPALKVAEVIRDGKTTRIVLATNDGLEAGRHEGMLYIFTNDPDYEELQAPVTVIKGQRALVQIVPEQPQVRLPAGAASGAVVVRLRSLTGKPVRIAKMESDDPQLTCTWAAGPGDDATVRLQVRRGERTSGKTSTQLRATLESGAVVSMSAHIIVE
jgi:hypothetical protein